MDKVGFCAVISYIVLKGSPKQVYKDMIVTRREDAPSYSMVKMKLLNSNMSQRAWKMTAYLEGQSLSTRS